MRPRLGTDPAGPVLQEGTFREPADRPGPNTPSSGTHVSGAQAVLDAPAVPHSFDRPTLSRGDDVPLSRSHVRATVKECPTRYPQEREALACLPSVLDGPRDPFGRAARPGHVTCGTAAIDRGRHVIDVHDIDAAPAGGEVAYQHHDFRFVFCLTAERPPPPAVRDEEVPEARLTAGNEGLDRLNPSPGLGDLIRRHAAEHPPAAVPGPDAGRLYSRMGRGRR
ncbi:hypothetical protein ACICHK_01900 [Streptomyces sp. AHU1]|uniref:hypothetical protein n=1 Tax=Streptomyces sp. AHU1 TaxID=3377215 RepID=UPI003877EC76